MGFPIYKTVQLENWLKKNWQHWDEKRMKVQKQHDGYGFYLYFAVDNHLLSEPLSIYNEENLRESLQRIENNRVYKIKRMIDE